MNEKHQPSPGTPDVEAQLDAAIWAVQSEPIDIAAVDRVKSRAEDLAAMPPEKLRLASARNSDRRRVLTFASLAVGILLAAAAWMMLSPTRPASAAAVFAAAIEQLESTGAFRYTQLIYSTQQEKPIESRVLVAADGRERQELSLGGTVTVSLIDSNGQPRLSLSEATKVARVMEWGIEIPDQGQRQLKWIEQLRSAGEEPDEVLGAKTLDGRRVEGFVTRLGVHVFTIWVDAATHALVQIEHDGLVEGSAITKLVMKDFHFNQTFDESLFSFEVPPGYTVEKVSVPSLSSGKTMDEMLEDNVVEALRGYTKLSEGRFPKSIVNWGEWAVLLSQSDLPPEEQRAISGRLGGILPFLTNRAKDDYEYVGAGKSTDDEHAIVFWYRTKEGAIRAVYNDLTVSEIEEKDLPASE